MDLSFLIELGGPVAAFLGQALVLGIFVYWLQKGLNAQFADMDARPRKLAKRLSSHLLGPLIALLLYGSKVLVTPRRGWWGYTTAFVIGWAGSIAAVAWHHRYGKHAKKGKLPK